MARYFNNFPGLVPANYILIDSSEINNLSEFSISFWIMIVTNASNNGQVTIEHINSANSTWNSYILLSRLLFLFKVKRATIDAVTEDEIGKFDMGLDAWNHLVFTFKLGSEPRAFWNGVECPYQVATRTAGAGSLPGDDGLLKVGAGSFAGILIKPKVRMAELGYWNRELTEDEISLLSNTSSPYSPIVISDGLVGCWRLNGVGTDYEPDYKNDQIGTIYGTLPITTLPYEVKTRIDDVPSSVILSAAAPSWERGKILAQKIITSSRDVSKVSLFLDVVPTGRADYIEEENGIACWSAANFQSISEPHAYLLYDNVSDYVPSDDISVNQGFLTNAGVAAYSTADDAIISSPKVSYNIFLGAGTYKLAVRAFGSGNIWYSWDSDPELDSFTFSADNIWYKVGDLYFEEPAVHTFDIYLGNISSAQAIKIDQFRILRTDYEDVTNTIVEGQYITYPTTRAPFNAYVRLRDLSSGDVGSVSSLSTRGWGWLSSKHIVSTGWHNFDINNYSINEGLSLEYIIISGREDFNAQWNYSISTSSNTYYSSNYGNSFVKD